VLKAVFNAFTEGFSEPILVGNEDEIKTCLDECKIPSNIFEIIDVKGDVAQQSKKAVELVACGEAQMLMKGHVDTSLLLKSVLNEKSLRTGRIMSGVALIESEEYHKMLMLSDPAMNLRPNLEEKKQIIENTAQVARALEIIKPKTALLCAKEKVNPKMPETVDAGKLVEMNVNGELDGFILGGPFAFDNIVSMEAARIKGIKHTVAGDADIIIAPELVTANALYKSMVLFGNAKSAGVILGAKVPIILTSRADNDETKLYSIAAASLIAQSNQE